MDGNKNVVTYFVEPSQYNTYHEVMHGYYQRYNTPIDRLEQRLQDLTSMPTGGIEKDGPDQI